MPSYESKRMPRLEGANPAEKRGAAVGLTVRLTVSRIWGRLSRALVSGTRLFLCSRSVERWSGEAPPWRLSSEHPRVDSWSVDVGGVSSREARDGAGPT